jgi:hydrogenase maturation protein HypF
VSGGPPDRRVLRVRGTVQGVGFRPFVYRLAVELGLRGAVWNEPDGVVVDAEGGREALDALARRIREEAPPRAEVESVDVQAAVPAGQGPFAIRASAGQEAASARVPPDLATCEPCLRELIDPADRRHRYPFINCTDCGPRHSIVIDVPYDRARTTMAGFTMCGSCAVEYHDPRSRRFHAQPNACPRCGPRVWIHGGPDGGEALTAAVTALRRGAIVAVKGLGGFHLACDARDDEALRRLRARKRRPHKPFAVMFPDLAALSREAVVDADARAVLLSPRAPILLLPRRSPSALSGEVAPRLREIGAFLPYTPLHRLLLDAFGAPLVMTSGNRGEEPIAAGNEEALERLRDVADLFLLHDREVHARADDSVSRVLLGRERLVRRARGCVPEAIALDLDGPEVLAVGADLKNAPCLAQGGAAVLGQHVGDLEHLESQRFFAEARAGLERLFRARPRVIAHDLHPGYHGTALALGSGLPTVAVQHHHAHVASCLADNGRRDRVIGVAWDGTGHGPDGTVWGGEILIADLAGCERVGRLRPVALAGGDAAVREPWRMALAHLLDAGCDTARVRVRGRHTVEAMIREGLNSVPTSSVGRLFDAVASLAGIRDIATYEGQAAVELEAAAADVDATPYPLPVSDAGLLELDARPLVAALALDLDRGADAALVSARFHRSLAGALRQACERVRDQSGLGVVALSGGCFQNRRLTLLAVEELEAAGFEVLLHARVPASDGGIALGQAAVALAGGGRRRPPGNAV